MPLGIYGESQAVWIGPAAALRADAEFMILTAAPPISWGEEILHEELTDQGLDQDEIARRLADTPPRGAEPRADIQRLAIPTSWLYGSADTVIPVAYSLDVLEGIEAAGDLDASIRVLEGGGHSLIHHPDLFPAVTEWIDATLGV